MLIEFQRLEEAIVEDMPRDLEGPTDDLVEELLGVRFLPNVDSHTGITNFNAILASAKRRRTLYNEEVKGLFIDALERTYYAAAINRLMLNDQRTAIDLTTIQLWTRECYASNVNAGVAIGGRNGTT
ncbi:hypothetical protein CYMTET_33394 [Cymbomonas tetramitiformis]|uniref:Uncharacterized protein n=1 Tax=Cymbomonas tetramitiformis TaxID=36881 RepID=A0AAE0FDR1_9CHLO|nr:hypothetical protein CYMTET_56680 [Cymbomonas tetramitiformis]KAK3257518.1 hypothetical protein CYMTET_33394 [Cymbomonas tetramitiformis]